MCLHVFSENQSRATADDLPPERTVASAAVEGRCGVHVGEEEARAGEGGCRLGLGLPRAGGDWEARCRAVDEGE